MNTTKLKRFANEARNKLRQGVEKRLAMLGFNDAGIPAEAPKLVSGGAVWKDKPCTVAFYNEFKSLEEQIQRYGVSHVVEEVAYTWFNRLMAIRILTMNELCEPVLRYVGSTRTPLIVDKARQGHLPEMDTEDREALMKLIDDDTKTAEQFAMLISAFCHNTPLIAKCFSLQSDYTDVLFPANILAENGFIDTLNTTDFITEDDYHSSELLGWLYQFYISEKKDQVFAKKGKYDADDIPAATQIFTPNWIVKYMVQNTIGGVLGGKDKLPENQRKYYVDTPEPPKAICRDIEELKVADLACGSGHILNECFDLLYDLYISEGYTRREAIECIFNQNLTGIDIDTRAKQLATFALMLKACQRDSSLVDASLMPKIFTVPSLENTTWETIYKQIVIGYEVRPESQNVYDELEKAFTVVQSASILGSIIKFELSNEAIGYLRALNKLTSKTLSLPDVGKTYPIGIKEGKAFEGISYKEAEDGEFISYYNSYRLIKDAINFILALSDVYDAIVMNPPYMPTNKIDALSKYVNEHYKEGKADMFAVFMMVCMDRLKDGGRIGMINMQSWMFLSSFEALRKLFLKEYILSSMLHLGPRTFDELSGEVVQNTAFVFEKAEPNDSTKGVYYRLVDGTNCSDKEDMFLSNTNQFEVSQSNFDKIPGAPIAYWVSEKVRETFTNKLQF